MPHYVFLFVCKHNAPSFDLNAYEQKLILKAKFTRKYCSRIYEVVPNSPNIKIVRYALWPLAIAFKDFADMKAHFDDDFALCFDAVQAKIHDVYGPQWALINAPGANDAWAHRRSTLDKDLEMRGKIDEHDVIFMRLPEFARPHAKWWVEQWEREEQEANAGDINFWIAQVEQERNEQGLPCDDIDVLHECATQRAVAFQQQREHERQQQTQAQQDVGMLWTGDGQGRLATAAEAQGQPGTFVLFAKRLPVAFDQELARQRLLAMQR